MDISAILSTVFDLLQSPWVWLILIASLMYAAGNYIDELLLTKYEQEIGTLVIISTLFGGVVVLFFFITALFNNSPLLLDTPIIIQALAVGVLEALWVIPYLYATERSGAIVAGPLFQAVPVIALGMEATLGVVPPALQILGALIVVAGGVLVSIEKDEEEEKFVIDWTTVSMMTLSVTLVALIYVLFRDAALAANFIGIGFWVGWGTLLTGVAIYLFYKPYRDDFNAFCGHANYKAVAIQLGNEVLDVGGAYLTNLATIVGPSVMIVTAFNATQPIFIGIIGVALAALGIAGTSTEKLSGAAKALLFAGILLIAIGIVVIALGTK